MDSIRSLLFGMESAVPWAFLLYSLKVSIVLVLALGATSLMHKTAPIKRTLILRTAVAAVLTLPLIIAFSPNWNVGVIGSVATALYTARTVISPLGTEAAVPAAAEASGITWGAVLLLAWAIGVAAVVGRVVIGGTLSAIVVRRAKPAGAELSELCGRLSSDMGIGRRVRPVLSHSVSMPLATGILRPVVVLPSSAEGWSGDNARMVLLHELAHIKRHDIVWTILGTITAAVHWFNPLVWIVRKRLLIEAEKTCDDYVIAAGTGPAVYAEHLLAVAREFGGGRLLNPLGAGMARKTELEGRLMSVLSKRMRSAGAGKSLIALVLLLSAGIVVPLACLGGTAMASDNATVTVDDQSTKTSSDEYLPSVDEFVPVEIYPEMIKETKPEYPKAAMDSGIGGTVWVQALVGKKGNVRKVKLARSSGHKELDDSALKAAWQNEFTPATQKGVPVAVWVTYKVGFSIGREDGTAAKETPK